MKIADLLLKKEKKIERQKRLIKSLASENKTLQLNMGDVGELIDKMNALRAENSSLQKEYAEFVQSAGDKIQELKKVKDPNDRGHLETCVSEFIEKDQFQIDGINYQKPHGKIQIITVTVINKGKPIL